MEAMRMQSHYGGNGLLSFSHHHYQHQLQHQTSTDSNSSNSSGNSSSSMDYSKIGRTVKTALLKAQAESRVIIGLSSAISVLSKAPEGSLFCLMAVPQAGDSATHMHEVLLEAFCYENDIYVIKVDCPLKLSRILGKQTIESCCLIQKTWTGTQQQTAESGSDSEEDEQLNKHETMLVDYCEEYWDSPQHPVVELPNV